MRGRSIHARALHRQVGSQRHLAPSIATPSSVHAATSSRTTRGFISSSGSRSTRTSPRRVSAANALVSSSSSSKSAPSSGSSASSSPPDGANSSSSSSGSNNGGSSSASASSVNDKRGVTELGLSKPKVTQLQLRSQVPGVAPANPPPSSLASVAWESFYSMDRPLLQHAMLPPRSKRSGPFSMSSQSSSGGSLTAIFTAEGSLATFGNFSQDAPLKWRRRMRNIAAERFNELIDGLADKKEGAVEAEAEEGETRWLVSSFAPESDRVAVESAKLEEEERIKEEEEEAIQNAIERGEDPEAARKLGAEADLVILGEPNGPSPKWARGVATYLAEKGRAYEPPAAPCTDATKADGKDAGSLAPHVANSVFFTDDDPNLMLSHAMVQTTLPLALKWDKLVAQMDAVALNDPSKANDTVDLSKLNAKLEPIRTKLGEEGDDVLMDSVRRKRRKKIRKHKYKKLRKAQRADRQRMKK